MEATPDVLLAAIFSAVARNDDETTSSLLIDLEYSCFERKQACDTVVDPVLAILARTSAPNNDCGFQVLLWLEGLFRELTDTGKASVKQFIAQNYGKFSDIVAEEMADFVGGFRNDWGIGVVSDWIANYETLACDAARSIDTAIREFQDHPAHARSDDVYRERVQELAIRLREKRRGITSSAG